MNQLVKELIRPLLEDSQKVTAVYGGGFKPPIKGHFSLVKKALKDLPEIDDFIIYVGGGVRDGITQEQSMEIWGIYQEVLGPKVQIEPSAQPIRDVIRYAKDHPDELVYFVIGYREGRQDDLQDIASRTKGVEEKYPNLKVKVITTPNPEISGTNARKAASKGDKEKFLTFLPDEVPPGEKEEIYNIVDKAILKEGDPKVGTGKKPKGSGRRLYTDEDPSDTVSVKFSTKQDIIDTLSKSSFKSKSHARQSQIINLIHQRVRAAYERAKDPDVKKRLKTALDYAEQRKEASKEKTQRLKKENVAPNHTGKAAPYGSGYDKVEEKSGFGGRTRYRAIEKRGDKYYYIQDNPFSPGIRQEFGPYKTKAAAKRKMGTFPPSQNYRDITENTIPSINILEKLAELTNYMREKGYNIDPTPSIKLVGDDVGNAENFFGKTAYYDPNEQLIVLYTQGRHPKDIVRSYAHEMIHHIQNLENRLGNITTTNTAEDDHLDNIEREAYEEGNIAFRNWTDSLQEGLYDDTKSFDLVKQNPFDIKKLADKGIVFITKPGDGKGGVAEPNWEGDASVLTLYNMDKAEPWMKVAVKNLMPQAIPYIQKDQDKLFYNGKYNQILWGIEKKGLNPKDFYLREGYNLNEAWAPTPLQQLVNDYLFLITFNFIHIDQTGKTPQDNAALTQMIRVAKPDVDKLTNLSKEQLEKNKNNILQRIHDMLTYIISRMKTHMKPEEYEKRRNRLNKLLSLYKTAASVKENIQEKKNKDPFGLNQFARELAQGLEEEEELQPKKYTIFCDMDGVLVDFDKGYKDLTGMSTHHADAQGKKEFWKVFRQSLVNKDISEESYWANLDWMPDGKELWNYIKDYNPYVLTAPAVNFDFPEELRYSREHNESIKGKLDWVKRLPGMRKIYFASAKNKAKFSGPNKILIDDRPDTISAWNANGGIGILHKNTQDTIRQLQELGL